MKEFFVSNLNAWYDRIHEDHWQDGRNWYKHAHQFCVHLSEETGLPLINVAGIVAALSPQVSWEVNLYSAESIVRYAQIDDRYTGYAVNVEKALQCLTAHPLTVLGGAKVLAFYHNLLSPRGGDHVTIDTHIARALFDTLELAPEHTRTVFSKAGNSVAQEALKAVARQKGVNPVELQAALWVCVRERVRKRVDKDQLALYSK